MAPEHDAAVLREVRRQEQLHGPARGFWEDAPHPRQQRGAVTVR
jgi:hypothetical protein